jgi:hypothetical protein
MDAWNEFSKQLEITQQSAQKAIEQCREIQFYHEKEINLYDEMLLLCNKLLED